MAGRGAAARSLLLVVAVGVLVYGGVSFWAELDRAASGLAAFRWWVLGPVLALSVLNYCLRALRWEYYLRLLAVRLPLLKSAAIFFASLVFCITPGRVGEVCKSYFVNKTDGTPMARTVPVVLAERLSDLLATGLLAAVGLLGFRLGWEIVAMALLLVLSLVVIMGSKRLAEAAFAKLSKVPRIGRAAPHLLSLYEGAYTLMRPAPLAVAMVLSVPAWFTECLGCYLVLGAFGVQVPLLAATFAYTLATIAGALSMLPGGLGATEGSLAVLLAGMGVDPTTAIAATFVTRACTLWFAVGLGALLLLAKSRELCGGAGLTQVIEEARRIG
jgi:uncharacterized protein (TIRG00374 family)